MMRWVADENFNGKLFNALKLRLPNLDMIRVQDTDLYSQPDPVVLEWAAKENRIILTHDVQTLVNDAYQRIMQGLEMPGVVLIPNSLPIGRAVDDLELLIGAGSHEDFDNQVIFIPLK